jgi:hypothetical protein
MTFDSSRIPESMGDGVKFLLGTLSISAVLLMVAVSWTDPHSELIAVHGGTEHPGLGAEGEPQLADLVDSPLMYAKVNSSRESVPLMC